MKKEAGYLTLVYTSFFIIVLFYAIVLVNTATNGSYYWFDKMISINVDLWKFHVFTLIVIRFFLYAFKENIAINILYKLLCLFILYIFMASYLLLSSIS